MKLNGFDPVAIERDMKRQMDRETARATGARSPAVRAAAIVLRREMRRVVSVPGTRSEPSPPGAPPHRIKGTLRSSIKTAVVDGIRRVGTGFYKARITEFGSVHAAPRPFARAGLDAAEPQMMDAFVSEMKALAVPGTE